jgi:hypothetical protein
MMNKGMDLAAVQLHTSNGRDRVKVTDCQTLMVNQFVIHSL